MDYIIWKDQHLQLTWNYILILLIWIINEFDSYFPSKLVHNMGQRMGFSPRSQGFPNKSETYNDIVFHMCDFCFKIC